MDIYICIKSAGRRPSLDRILYKIPDQVTTLRSFLTELVGIETETYNRKADCVKAVKNAIQCFEDGMVRVFQNETELKNLDEPVQIQEGDCFTLIRLTFLAGRLW